MNDKEINKWKKINSAKLYVSKEHFHHHAYEILNTHSDLRDDLIRCLSSKILVETRVKITKGNKSKGIKADILNIELRKLLQSKLENEVKFEVNEEKGVFYFSAEKSTIGGFDFAILNHTKNINSLRNLCFGELHYHEGEKRWNDFLKKNRDLLHIAKELEENFNPRESVPSFSSYLSSTLIKSKQAKKILNGYENIKYGNGKLQTLDIYGKKYN